MTRRKRRWRRNRRSQVQCNLPQQCSRVVFVAKASVSFLPVNKEEDEEEVEENKQQEENKIITTMQSSIAMLQSCT